MVSAGALSKIKIVYQTVVQECLLTGTKREQAKGLEARSRPYNKNRIRAKVFLVLCLKSTQPNQSQQMCAYQNQTGSWGAGRPSGALSEIELVYPTQQNCSEQMPAYQNQQEQNGGWQ